MLAKIEDVLKRGKASDSPAYTLILGAGASFGVVPTAKEMLGIPDTKSGRVHEKSIPIWLAKQLDPKLAFGTDGERLKCSIDFWKSFVAVNADNPKCKGIHRGANGLPEGGSVAAAYQAVFETSCIAGLDTPERQRNYMREVTMTNQAGSAQLNATHFYLASLLSLQSRTGKLGIGKQSLYTGRREFARSIFTTNFDPLLQTSLQLFQLLYYMTDRPEILSADALQTDQHPAIHLFYAHGSVHRPYLANTEDQIALLKQQNARDLASYLGSHGVIVLGYSGWDDCLLEALNQSKTFSNNLYWLARGSESISGSVVKFLVSHPNAYWVEIEDGGSWMAELHNRLCPGAPNTEMLYNPVRPLLSQLRSVSFAGVRSSRPTGGEGTYLDDATDVEDVREQIIRRLEDAQKLFTEPARPDTDWEELGRQADLSYANKDWEAALGGYDRFLAGNDHSQERKALVLFRRGVCYSRIGQVDKAIANYTDAINVPGAPAEQVAKALINRGLCLSRKGEEEAGEADYDTVIHMVGIAMDQRAKALYNRGVYFDRRNEVDKAIADYSAVIDMIDVPIDQQAKALINRGICFGRKSEVDKAIADYSAVIDMAEAPIDHKAGALLNRGGCFGHKGELDKAIADLTLVIDLVGASVDQKAGALVNRGYWFDRRGDADKEIADYTAVIDMVGAPVEQRAKALFNRGVCFGQKGEIDKAVADYLAVVEMPGGPKGIVAAARENLHINKEMGRLIN